MRVTPAAYAQLIWSLSGLAGGRLVVMLEGGYCLDSLAESAALTLRALLGTYNIECLSYLVSVLRVRIQDLLPF
jgi:acetoin utilization deacetylase AcuC-like enzyme